MTMPSEQGTCRIIGGAKLPAETGGQAALCAAIAAAASKQAPGVAFTTELRVLSASSLVATIRMKDGRTLPEQKLAVSDRKLNRASIDRFATALATLIATAGNR